MYGVNGAALIKEGMTVLKHYYRLVYWKRRLTRAIPGAGAPVRIRRPRTARAVGRFRPLMVFGAIVLIAVAVSYGIGTWEAGEAPQPSGRTDPQAECEQRLEADCPGAAPDTCEKLLAQVREGNSGTGGGSSSGQQGLTFVRCRIAG
ncbi:MULTISPECIES: hypothetical protein [unclassified Streptomyces]|uniref:hypothetical protein n=1 Tax=unclassified Streptomyces TaxID=2593676 RepID=UPI0032531A59